MAKTLLRCRHDAESCSLILQTGPYPDSLELYKVTKEKDKFNLEDCIQAVGAREISELPGIATNGKTAEEIQGLLLEHHELDFNLNTELDQL